MPSPDQRITCRRLGVDRRSATDRRQINKGRNEGDRRAHQERRTGFERRSGEDRRKDHETADTLLNEYGADAVLSFIDEKLQTANDLQREELLSVQAAINVLLAREITKTKM